MQMQLVTGSHARYKEMIMTGKKRRRVMKKRAAIDIIPSLDHTHVTGRCCKDRPRHASMKPPINDQPSILSRPL